MRLWDLIFLVSIFILYWLLFGDRLIPVKNHSVQFIQGVSNVIRPTAR